MIKKYSCISFLFEGSIFKPLVTYNYCHNIIALLSITILSEALQVMFPRVSVQTFFLLTLNSPCCQIVHWRNHLRFPEDPHLTLEAKDLIYRLMCDVDHRLGTQGANEIKVRCSSYYYILM